MAAKGSLITLEPSFGISPETVLAGEATPDQLYDALDAWISHKARYGRGRTEAAAHARGIAKTEMGRIRKELSRRGLSVGRTWKPR